MGEEKVPIKVEQSSIVQVLVAVFVIVLTLVLFALYKRRKNARRGVLLVGLCESGKTVLFIQLVYKKHASTYTSIKENVADYIVKGTSLRIIDIPGHERLREKFFDKYKSIARGIVFVVDSVTLQKDIRDVAEYLYNILTDNVVSSTTPSVLILCNKQDVSLAKGPNAVKSILEKELNTLRITKSNQLDSVDPKAKKNADLARNGENFDFNLLNIEFAESCGYSKDNTVRITELEKWLSKIA